MENGQEKNTASAVTVTDEYAVVVADKQGLQAFFTDGANLVTLYGAIEKKALGLVADVNTKEGRSQIKSAARQLASVKVKVDELGKNVVAELKKLPGVIDENRKAFRKKMESLQEEIRRPVTEIEERQKKLEAIAATHINLAMADSATLESEIRKLEQANLTREEWKESLDDAVMTIGGEINAMKVLREAALKKEEDARRLAELEAKQAEAERIIREQKIKEEAERRAKAEAEARAAAEKARLEREKEEAERRAAEAERKAQEAKEAARMAEQRKEQAPTAPTPMSKTLPASKPSAWTPEMKAVNKAVYEQIAEYVLPEIRKTIVGFTENGYRVAAEEAAKAVVKAILTGKISNLKVEY